MTNAPDMMTDIDRLLALGHSHVEVLASDMAGNHFGKRYPAEHLRDFARNGVSMPRSMFVLTQVGGSIDEYTGMGLDDGDPDIAMGLVPGEISVVHYGRKPRLQALITSTADTDMPDPRRILKRVLSQYQAKGLTPITALELEFTLFDQATTKAGTLGPARDPMTGRSELHGMLNVDRLDGYEAFVEEVLANCDAQGIDTTAICSEFGNSQFEINFTHYEDPLKAADKAQLYKRTVKAVARKHGFLASFMAKPDLQLPSNGQHIHVSVVDEAGANIFSNGDTHTDTLMHAIAGLQAGAKDAMLCWAPNINSYRRFEPGFCVPTGPTWAYDHRHIAFRIPPGTGQAWRIENRLAGADANCYLSLAATLAAMLVGIDRKLTPSAETKGAPPLDYESLPLTIRDAIAAMRDGSVIKSILGADFIELYASYREGELDAFEGVITPRELDWYL